MTTPSMDHQRRDLLGGLASVGTVMVTGCVGGGDDDTEDEHDPYDQFSADTIGNPPIEFREPNSNELIANVQPHPDAEGHWHRQPFQIPLADTRSVKVQVIDQNKEPVSIGVDGVVRLALSQTAETPPEVFETEVNGEMVTFRGTAAGDGRLVVDLVRNEDDAVVWTSPELLVSVS